MGRLINKLHIDLKGRRYVIACPSLLSFFFLVTVVLRNKKKEDEKREEGHALWALAKRE